MQISPHERHRPGLNPYLGFAINLGGSLAVMYFAMFAMIDGTADFFNNLNMLYMALMMAAPMGPLMLLTMPGMYPSRAINMALHALCVAVFALAFMAIRYQAPIGDAQFVRSMVPHHSGAILMCREAELSDPELRSLCEGIVRSQAEEIAQMKRILERL
jgi:uncharacterized protein (DUF305 family)